MSAKDTVVATKEVPAPPRQPRFSLRAPRDPGFAALRRPARAAIVIPLAFPLGTFVLHLGQNVIFIVFGCFSPLVITPFGGLRSPRSRAAEQAARREYVATAKRPAGPARRDRALAQLLIELQRIVDIVEHPFYQYRASVVPRIAERDRLAASTVAALRASGDVLTGGTPPDLRAVEDARLAHRAALDRWAGEELKAGRPADQVLDGLDVDHTLRVIAYLTIALGSNAIITAGGRPEVNVGRSVSASGGLGGVMLRVLGTIRTHLDPSSTVVQSSLRIAIGLAIAVVVANRLGLQHGFWVVLGTLQVLRSNALGTGRTTAQAIGGNLLGVVLGGLFALGAGTNGVL